MPREYKRGSHTVFNIELHIAWITKYRYKVLQKDIGIRTRELLRRICTEEDVEIISGVVSLDHVHMFVSLPPSLSPSKLVKYLKGKTSRKLQMEFPQLKKRYWGQHLWARGYFCISTGNVSSEMIKKYIKAHGEGKTTKDTFIIEDAKSSSDD